MTMVSNLVISSSFSLLLNLNNVLSAVSAFVILRNARIVASRTAVRSYWVARFVVISIGSDYSRHYGRIMGFSIMMASTVRFVL